MQHLKIMLTVHALFVKSILNISECD